MPPYSRRYIIVERVFMPVFNELQTEELSINRALLNKDAHNSNHRNYFAYRLIKDTKIMKTDLSYSFEYAVINIEMSLRWKNIDYRWLVAFCNSKIKLLWEMFTICYWTWLKQENAA